MGKKVVSNQWRPKTVGPVADLERHLPSDWWRTLFNSIYLKTDGDVVENNKNTAQEIDMLVQHAGLELNDRILDLCCGQGRHCLELARRGFKNVTGVDRSRVPDPPGQEAGPQGRRAGQLPRGRRPQVPAAGELLPLRHADGQLLRLLRPRGGRHPGPRGVKRVLVPSGLVVMDLADGEWIKAHFDQRSLGMDR